MVYVKADVTTLPGKLPRFSELMKELVPVIAEIQWVLTGAYLNVSGRQESFVLLWQVPDANAIFKLGGQVAKNPRLAELLGNIQQCIEPQVITLMADAPFSAARSRPAT